MSDAKILYNQLENTLETFFKKLDVEVNKSIHEFIRNPKQLELNLTNLQVDLAEFSEKISTLDNVFFEQLKGMLHSFEAQALKLIKTYVVGPKMEDTTSKIEYSKNLEDLLGELRGILDKIFTLIRKQAL
ncbi:MAG: hypothetical protein COT84_02145 [Chlamydiae bacterium CG10_big_fil_rev_8_21_14_0_10_35_9]|nr:MAG: hypothetical protein COT84_02145 [Chlamydiae bacterium CG10_big_fil_rev_8_21_14_0_10_35_9]